VFLLYPFMALASVACTLLTWVLAPLLALLVLPDGNLPRLLYWFQTFDNPVTAGMAPPYSWPHQAYVCSVLWLWRNPAYGFDMFLLGCPFTAEDWFVVKDTPTCFFAYSRWGAFSYRGSYFKWGWKAWARLSGVPNWTAYSRIPITVMK
jgi:hypothetical protein